MGPKSREILSKVTDIDLSNEAFPFSTSQDIGDGVRASRISYMGELGWELYVPTEIADHFFERLRSHHPSLRFGGYYAIDSLRLEKGYRAWGGDISPDDTPLESGLGFAVNYDKDFIGKEALLKQKAEGRNST